MKCITFYVSININNIYCRSKLTDYLQLLLCRFNKTLITEVETGIKINTSVQLINNNHFIEYIYELYNK